MMDFFMQRSSIAPRPLTGLSVQVSTIISMAAPNDRLLSWSWGSQDLINFPISVDESFPIAWYFADLNVQGRSTRPKTLGIVSAPPDF
jgi:hypothetical protein